MTRPAPLGRIVTATRNLAALWLFERALDIGEAEFCTALTRDLWAGNSTAAVVQRTEYGVFCDDGDLCDEFDELGRARDTAVWADDSDSGCPCGTRHVVMQRTIREATGPWRCVAERTASHG